MCLGEVTLAAGTAIASPVPPRCSLALFFIRSKAALEKGQALEAATQRIHQLEMKIESLSAHMAQLSLYMDVVLDKLALQKADLMKDPSP